MKATSFSLGCLASIFVALFRMSAISRKASVTAMHLALQMTQKMSRDLGSYQKEQVESAHNVHNVKACPPVDTFREVQLICEDGQKHSHSTHIQSHAIPGYGSDIGNQILL
jgi:hypothetical protein